MADSLRQPHFGRAIAAATWMLLLLAYCLATTPTQANNHIIFVDNNATGANNGTSWANAYVNLQSALTAAQAGNEIWVVAGTYIPGITNTSTFQLKNGVAIYGGFAGNESSLDQRNVALNPSILSGNLNPTTNAFHVVLASGVDRSAILDGFFITAGKALGASHFPCFEQCGGGIYINNGSPTLSNLRVAQNDAHYGAGMYIYNNSTPLLESIVFYDNIAKANGGGIQVDTSTPVLDNVIFDRNLAEIYGGAMLNNAADPILLNVLIGENLAKQSGGGIFNLADSEPVLNRVLFWGNVATLYGGAIANQGSSPTLVNVVMSGNAAGTSGGAVFHTGYSSGIWSQITISCSAAGLPNDHFTVDIGSTLSLHNSIIWTDDDKTYNVINQSGTDVSISHSLIFNSGGSGAGWNSALGVDGGGNIDSATSPFVRDCDDGGDGFANTGNNDYGDLSLKPTAPALDAGDNSLIPPDSQDLDGDGNTTEPLSQALSDLPRVAAVKQLPATVDMGAYERENGIPIAHMNGPHTINEGSSVALDASTSTDDLGISSYAWDCTDNGSADVTATSPTGSNCAYADEGNFVLRLTVTDAAGASASSTTAVDVNNVAPILTDPQDQSTIAGVPKAFDLGTFTDPGADAPWIVTVDWGDTTDPITFNANLPGDLTREYVYTAMGTYNVVVKLTDGSVEVAGGFQIIVNAPPPGAPKVTPPAAQEATVGVANSFTLGSFTDAGDAAPWQATVDWGDQSDNTQFQANSAGNLPNRSHSYVAAGNYTVIVSVDDGELLGSATFQVTVSPAITEAKQIFIPAITR